MKTRLKLKIQEAGKQLLVYWLGRNASKVFYFGINSALPSSYYDCEDERKFVFNTSFYITLLGASLQLHCEIIFEIQASIINI